LPARLLTSLSSKQQLRQGVDEYCQSFDVDTFTRDLHTYDVTLYHSDIAYVLHKYSLDKSTLQRTAVDKLLIALVKRGVLTSAQLAAGIRKTSDHIDDIAVDVVNAPMLLHESIQFLVASGVLPVEVEREIDESNELLSDSKTVQSIKDHYEQIIDDFFDDPHVQHTCDELIDLHTLYFAHQSVEYASALKYYFITKLINHALDRSNDDREHACKLLSAVVPSIISIDQAIKAFEYTAR